MYALDAHTLSYTHNSAMYPRLQAAGSSSTAWEDESFEPQLGGCVALEALLLSSPALNPHTLLRSLGEALPTLRTLALPQVRRVTDDWAFPAVNQSCSSIAYPTPIKTTQCFNTRVTTTCREVLSAINAALPYLKELDLRGCNWVTERGLLGWVQATTSGGGGGGGGKEPQAGEQQHQKQEQRREQQGPPASLRRLIVDARFARQPELRAAFAGYSSGAGQESVGIELVAWEEVGLIIRHDR